MAEEEKREAEQASSQEGQEASELEAQEQAAAEEEVDYKQRYEELEKQHTEVSQKAKESEQLIETISPFVDWNAAQGRQAPAAEPQEGLEGGEEEFVSKKAHDEALRKAQDQTDIKLLTMQFKQDHPDLVPYEKLIVGPAIVSLRNQNPHLPPDQLLEKAAAFAKDFLEKERGKGREQLEQEAKEKEEQEKQKKAEAAKASGFASAGKTSPATKEEKAGQSTEEYFKARQEQSRKSRGIP